MEAIRGGVRTTFGVTSIVVSTAVLQGCGARTALPVDEGVCFEATLTPWQFHDTPGPMCVDLMVSDHGDPQEFDYASIPPEDDPGWTSYASRTIDFSRSSRLCGTACPCFGGVDFDYWQTFLDVPQGADVSTLTFAIGAVDDGARVTVFNALHPQGAVDPGSFVQLGKGGRVSAVARLVTVGKNRIVLTHVDDCCVASYVEGAELTLNDAPANTCKGN